MTATATATAPRQSVPPLLLGVVLLTLCMLAGMAMGWVGYIGSDDWVYISSARERMETPWLIGTDHWKVRLTMTLPMAASFAAFGQSEFSAVLPTLAYAWATGVLVLAFLWRRAGAAAALLAGFFMALSPLLVINATSLRIDAVENFFVVAALLTFLAALEREGPAWLLLVSGVLAALAFTTRPTAVALLVFYGVLFLTGFGMGRARYLWVAVGFGAVWVAESVYYFLGTGRWFYRLGVDFGHDQVVRAGTLLDAVLLAPVRMLLTSHSFGLAFWVLPVMAWYAVRAPMAGEALPRLVRLMTVFISVWTVVFSGFASKLVLDPRYLAPALTATLMVIAIGVALLWQRGCRALAIGTAASVVAVQTLGIYLENKDFLYAERWLVRLAQQHTEPVYTDPQTRERALFLLQIAGVEKRVRAEPPPPGSLFLTVPRNALRGQYNAILWRPQDYQPGNWSVQASLDPGPTLLGRLLRTTGLETWLTPEIMIKISRPNPIIQLLRKPGDTPGAQSISAQSSLSDHLA